MKDERTYEERQAHRALANEIVHNETDGDILATFGAHGLDRTKFGDVDCSDSIEAVLLGLSLEVAALNAEREHLVAANQETLNEIAAIRRTHDREIAQLKAEIAEIKESHDAAGWDHAERSEMQTDD